MALLGDQDQQKRVVSAKVTSLVDRCLQAYVRQESGDFSGTRAWVKEYLDLYKQSYATEEVRTIVELTRRAQVIVFVLEQGWKITIREVIADYLADDDPELRKLAIYFLLETEDWNMDFDPQKNPALKGYDYRKPTKGSIEDWKVHIQKNVKPLLVGLLEAKRRLMLGLPEPPRAKSPRTEALERIRDAKTLEEKIRIAEAYEAQQWAHGNFEWIGIEGRPPQPMPPEPWNTKWRWGTVYGHKWVRLYKRAQTGNERTEAYLKWTRGFDGLEDKDFEEARQYWQDLKKQYENLKAVPPSERVETIYVHKLINSIVTCKLVEEFRASREKLIEFGNTRTIPDDEMKAIKKELEDKGLLKETNVPQGFEQEWP